MCHVSCCQNSPVLSPPSGEPGGESEPQVGAPWRFGLILRLPCSVNTPQVSPHLSLEYESLWL